MPQEQSTQSPQKKPFPWLLIFILGALWGIWSISGDRSDPSLSSHHHVGLALAVESWHCSPASGHVILEGRVKNISDEPIENIVAVAQHFDNQDVFVTSDSALIDFNPLMPGQTSPFEVISAYNPQMKSCTLSFTELRGKVIPYLPAPPKNKEQ